MLRLYDIGLKRGHLRHNIKVFENSELECQREYAEHLKRLLVAYDIEDGKARKRGIKNVEL